MTLFWPRFNTVKNRDLFFGGATLICGWPQVVKSRLWLNYFLPLTPPSRQICSVAKQWEIGFLLVANDFKKLKFLSCNHTPNFLKIKLLLIFMWSGQLIQFLSRISLSSKLMKKLLSNIGKALKSFWIDKKLLNLKKKELPQSEKWKIAQF